MSMRDRFSTLEFSPQGIPKWTTAQMSREWVETLEKEGRVKPWRNCQNCGATPASVGRSSLPRCGGCTDIQCADPPRYCSRKCQREAWEAHKKECKRNIEWEKRTTKENPLWIVPLVLTSQRQAWRWMNALMPDVLAWVVRQAYASNSVTVTHDILLRVEMRKSVSNQAQSPVWPVSFEFVDLYPEDNPNYKHEAIGRYRLAINYEAVRSGFVSISPIKGDDAGLNAPLPQWPWIFGQVSLMGDIHPEIAIIRLCHLVNIVKKFRNWDTNGYLDKFQAPKPFKRLEMTKESFDDWMKLMYPAVACFGSKFHPPSEVMDYNFGHLLRQCKPRYIDTSDEEVTGT